MPDLLSGIRTSGVCVLCAPPGAGKTTRVPAALLDLERDRDVVVVEPRRLAARMAARRVAAERGEPVGRSVGYEVRFERKLGASTRLRYVTEGVFLRQLAADPTLSRVGAVVLDELHERNLAGDLALAFARGLRAGSRPDLRIVAMSATLDPAPVARFLAGAPVVESQGRAFPVSVSYDDDARARRRDERPLERRVAAAVGEALRRGREETGHDAGGHPSRAGDILVFLPGAAEIRRSHKACADVASRHGVDVMLLHGDLPAAEQDRAVSPGPRRKLILSTNVAETSVTIEGVTWVIDSGLARVARCDPWSGLPSLALEPISQASAAQRAGRAGRTRPGHCIRLYDRHDHDRRGAFDTPEVARAELSGAVLLLCAMGVSDPERFGWFEPPAEAAIDAARELLLRLGAVTADAPGGGLTMTETGHRMLRLPLHPRQARVALEARRLGVGRAGYELAAAIGERTLRRARRAFADAGADAGGDSVVVGPSDFLDELDLLARARSLSLRPERLRSAGIEPGAARALDRAARQLASVFARERDQHDRGDAAPAGESSTTLEEVEQAQLRATLAGYPDRVVRRRRAHQPEVVFAGGGSGVLAPTSAVASAEFLVAVEARARGTGAGAPVIVHRASAIDPDWLLDMFVDRVRDTDELVWSAERERVERVRQLAYDGLVIDEDRAAGAEITADPALAERAAELLAEAALAAGPGAFADLDALASWRRRLAFAARCASPAGADTREAASDPGAPGDSSRGLDGADGLADGPEHGLGAEIERALRALCMGRTSFAELRAADLAAAVRAAITSEQRAQLDRFAPEFIAIPGRRRVRVHYEDDRPPWIASRLQDFFGLLATPTVGGGRVPLVVHLLAPNQRAVQVTSDLSGFWTRHYPALRRQLSRRYPRHAWPDDPRTAQPDRPARRGRRRNG